MIDTYTVSRLVFAPVAWTSQHGRYTVRIEGGAYQLLDNSTGLKIGRYASVGRAMDAANEHRKQELLR